MTPLTEQLVSALKDHERSIFEQLLREMVARKSLGPIAKLSESQIDAIVLELDIEIRERWAGSDPGVPTTTFDKLIEDYCVLRETINRLSACNGDDESIKRIN